MTTDRSNTPEPSTDTIDDLLAGAFDGALSAMERPALVEGVMRRIRARQRQRAILLLAIGLVAAVICVVNGLPLLALTTSALQHVSLTDGAPDLPAIVTAAVVLIGGIGVLSLLLDEAH
ncbi:MAG: hypothetical protein P8Y69_03190 [Gammaproteobacteria bacterium]